MKRSLLILALLVHGAMASAARAADRQPAISIEAAARLAEDYLKSSAAPGRFIAGLSLENPTVAGSSSWYARWSSPIIAEGKAELGLRIDMDGSLTKIVSGSRGATARGGSAPGGASVPAPGIGSQKFGVRNMH